jgi:hypothetical protein
MAATIESGEEFRRFYQERYFDSIDGGDAETAVTALHEDVEWVHRQVWEHDSHSSSDVDTLHGRDAVLDLLAPRIGEMQDVGIEHKIREAIVEDDRGSFRAEVVGPEGDTVPFVGWIELTDGLVSKYVVTPL